MKQFLKKLNFFLDDIIIDVIGAAFETIFWLVFDL